MRIYILLILFLTGISPGIQALDLDSLRPDGFRVTAALMGESLVHPGGLAGIEKNFWSKARLTSHRRSGKEKTTLHSLYWGGSFGGFNHANNEFLIFCSADVGYRLTTVKGNLWSAEMSLGVFRSFYNIPTYTLDGDGVQTVPRAGQGGLMPRTFLSWGRAYRLKNNRKWSWHLGPVIYLRTPYNHTTVVSGSWVFELVIYDLFVR